MNKDKLKEIGEGTMNIVAYSKSGVDKDKHKDFLMDLEESVNRKLEKRPENRDFKNESEGGFCGTLEYKTTFLNHSYLHERVEIVKSLLQAVNQDSYGEMYLNVNSSFGIKIEHKKVE